MRTGQGSTGTRGDLTIPPEVRNGCRFSLGSHVRKLRDGKGGRGRARINIIAEYKLYPPRAPLHYSRSPRHPPSLRVARSLGVCINPRWTVVREGERDVTASEARR